MIETAATLALATAIALAATKGLHIHIHHHNDQKTSSPLQLLEQSKKTAEEARAKGLAE